MKKIIVLVFILTVTFVFAVSCSKKKAVPEYGAKILFLVGDVKVLQSGVWNSAKEQMFLGKGTEIMTGDNSQCNLSVGSDSFISLKDKSHLVIDNILKDVNGLEQASVELKIGKTVVNPKKLLKGESFNIKTPTAIAAVRGTQFVVASDPSGELKVAVVDGKVELKRRVPALENVESSVVEKIDALSSLKAKVEEESIVIDANQSAFIDNKKADKENRIIEKAVADNIVVINEIIKEDKKAAESKTAETETKKAESKTRNDDLNKSLNLALAGADVLKKDAKKTPQIKLEEKVSREDVKAVEELETVIKEVKEKEQKQSGIQQKQKAELVVSSSVKGSEIYINGKMSGKEKVTVSLDPEKEISVEISAKGYETFKTSLSLTEGEKKEIVGTLIQEAKLVVSSPVKGSRIFINNKYIGMDDVAVSPGSGKKIDVQIVADGFKKYNVEVTLGSGESKEIRAVMERDKEAGRVKWTEKFGTSVMVKPVYYRNFIFVATNEGSLVAVNNDGRKIWKLDLKRRIESTPLVDNNVLYVAANNGDFYSINIYSGGINWKYKLEGTLLFGASPVVSGDRIYMATSFGKVYSFDTKGKVLWKRDLENGIYSSPALRDRMLFIGAEDHNIYAVSTTKGEVEWKFKADSRIVASSPIVSGSIVYVGCYSGNFYAIDVKKGKMVWSYKTGDSVMSSPEIFRNSIFFGSNDGYIYTLSLQSGALEWRYKTAAKVETKPAISDNMVFVTSGDTIYALSVGGKLQWSHKFNKNVRTSATVVGNDIFVGLESGEVASVRNSLIETYR